MHLLGPLTNRNDRFPFPFFNISNPNLSPSGSKPLRQEFECLKAMKNSLTRPCGFLTFLILERGSGCYRFCTWYTSLFCRGYWYLVHESQVAIRLLFKTHKFPWLDWAVRLLVIMLWRELWTIISRGAPWIPFSNYQRIVSLYTCHTCLYPLRRQNQRRRSSQSDRGRGRWELHIWFAMDRWSKIWRAMSTLGFFHFQMKNKMFDNGLAFS